MWSSLIPWRTRVLRVHSSLGHFGLIGDLMWFVLLLGRKRCFLVNVQAGTIKRVGREGCTHFHVGGNYSNCVDALTEHPRDGTQVLGVGSATYGQERGGQIRFCL